MIKSEVLKRLKDGQKIVEMNAPWGYEYFLSHDNQYTNKDKITKSQFEKYIKLCNKVMDEHHKRWLRTQSGYCYYWVEE